jgi:hypothetical protein
MSPDDLTDAVHALLEQALAAGLPVETILDAAGVAVDAFAAEHEDDANLPPLRD